MASRGPKLFDRVTVEIGFVGAMLPVARGIALAKRAGMTRLRWAGVVAVLGVLSTCALEERPAPPPAPPGFHLEPPAGHWVSGGFQLTAVTPGSMLSRLGLQNGDIMRRVNGIPVDGLDKTIAISESARDAGVAVVDIERDGAPLRLTWTRELVGP
jgi:hypothetical protein